jgi:tetratricopeptide (TPR) repeat protein
MNRFFVPFGLAAFLVLSLCGASRAQAPGSSPAPSQPSQPTRGAGSTRGNTSPAPSNQPNRGEQLPLYVDGRVLDDTAQPMAIPVSVKLNCAMRTIQSVRTDLQGYFRFVLGAGAQANTDFSAADAAPDPTLMPGIDSNGGFGGLSPTGNSLAGCELRISVPGYQPIMSPITDTASLGTIDLGVFQLRRTGTPAVGTVSASSLLVPNNARKEFDQGVKDLRSNHLPQATQHLQRAVAAYDKYAAAWNELGRAYSIGHQIGKAREAFQKAIAADPKFAPPFVGMATLEVEDEAYQDALDSLDKAVEADPTIVMGVAGYIQGLANFRLNRLDAAEQSLLQAEKGPHQAIPQLHALFADIYMQKQDPMNAAAQIRAYLKEAPRGPFAAQLRKQLDDISKSAAISGAKEAVAP